MRRSTRIAGPALMLAVYYTVVVLFFYFAPRLFPDIAHYMPFGGVEELLTQTRGTFEVIATTSPNIQFDAIRLAFAIFGTVLLMLPISWVYFITTRTKLIDRSFAQTIVVLPVVVAGVAVIVHDSLALAFSLAGVVAAVRFRFSLEEPAHALYIFAAIAIGLGAGIAALGISTVVSVAFVIVNMVLWRVDYGADLTSPFFSFLTGRGQDDNEL
jgi:hypothetical protein